jgi:hypothetical protein
VKSGKAAKELLAARDDVWALVSQAGRLADWWPGIFAAQDHGDTWTIEGDERAGMTRVADRGDDEREETVHVVKGQPDTLRLHFERSGYDAELALRASASNRTQATLTIVLAEPEETLAERLEKIITASVTSMDNVFAGEILDRLYDLCQTGADG